MRTCLISFGVVLLLLAATNLGHGQTLATGKLKAAAASPAGQTAEYGLPGDVDCSGAVDAVDALQVLRQVAGLPTAAPCMSQVGDVDCGGDINAVDALLILRSVAGFGGLPGCNPALWYLTRGASNTDEAWGVDVDPQGNIYLATHQTDPGPWPDMIISKLAPDGTEIWKTRWGGQWGEQAFVVTVSGSTVYVGGLTQHGSTYPHDADMAVIALDTGSGSLGWQFIWDQGFGYEEADGLVKDGNYLYVAGWTTGQTTSNDVALLKLDLDGNLIWSKTWGTSGWDEENGQIVVDSTRVYLAGRYNAPNMLFGGDAVVATFSKDRGDFVAETTWGGPLIDDALGMTSDGQHLYVVGITSNQGNASQIFLRKYSTNLSLVWETVWGGPGTESARVVKTDSEGILVAGWTDSFGAGKGDIVLMRFHQDGELLWSETWGGPGFEQAHGLAIYGSAAYIAGETTSFGAGKQDALLVKVNAHTGRFPAP